MYDAIEDPYCYPGTTVLKNRAGHRTQRALTQFETAMSAQRADEPLVLLFQFSNASLIRHLVSSSVVF
jgi:cell filamentation protein